MSAHHVKHSIACPCYGSQGGVPLDRCTCGAPGSAAAKKPVTLAEAAAAFGDTLPDDRAAQQGPQCPACGNRGGELMREIVGGRAVWCSLCSPEVTAEILRQLSENGSVVLAPGEDVAIEAAPAEDALDRETFARGRDASGFQHTSEMVSKMLQRPIWVVVDISWRWQAPGQRKLSVTQRCSACRADIESFITEQLAELSLITDAGVSARLAYAKHSCPPVEQQLAGMSREDLTQLEQDLEREMGRIGDRLLALQRFANPTSKRMT